MVLQISRQSIGLSPLVAAFLNPLIEFMQFTNTILCDGVALPVTFTKVFTIHGIIFFISIQRDGHNHYFDMTKLENNWIVEEGRGDWVKELEQKLSETINYKLENDQVD